MDPTPPKIRHHPQRRVARSCVEDSPRRGVRGAGPWCVSTALLLFCTPSHAAWDQIDPTEMAPDQETVTPDRRGPDLIISAIGEFSTGGGSDIASFGIVNNHATYALAVTVCNRGDTPANWYDEDGPEAPESPGAHHHPVIGQNLYRLCDGILQHIGTSALAHGYCATNESSCGECIETDCDTLGPGCADTAWSGLLATDLTPRKDVAPDTVAFAYPPQRTASDLDPDVRGRLHAAIDDIDPTLNPDARYFVETFILAADDRAAGHHRNNTTTIEVAFADDTNLTMRRVSEPAVGQSMVEYWAEIDPAVHVSEAALPDQSGGSILLASRVIDLADGFHRYVYAIHNPASDLAAAAFEAPLPPCAELRNPTAMMQRSADQSDITWETTRVRGALRYITATDDAGSESILPWSTTTTFALDTTFAPGRGRAVLDLGDHDLSIPLHTPRGRCEVACRADVAPINIDHTTGDGVVNADDLLAVISAFATADPRCDIAPLHADGTFGDREIDVNDLLIVLHNFNQTCP